MDDYCAHPIFVAGQSVTSFDKMPVTSTLACPAAFRRLTDLATA